MKSITVTALFFAATATTSPFASAQAVIDATIESSFQLQIGRDDEGFNVCGIRGAVTVPGVGNSVELYDFSVAIRYPMIYGMVKAGKMGVKMTPRNRPFNAIEDLEIIVPAPIKFWVAKESESKPLAVIKSLKSETPGFMLGLTDLADTYEIIAALADGERMQLVARYKNQKFDNVVTFQGQLNPTQRKSLDSCFSGIFSRFDSLRNNLPSDQERKGQ